MPQTKTCYSCNIEQPVENFYCHALMADGRLNICKECARVRARKNREEKIEKYREYDRNRSRETGRKVSVSANAKRARGRLSKATSQLVCRAIKRGELIRPEKCSDCGVVCKPHAHHDDHDRVYDVRWLCPACHAAAHRVLGLLGNHAPRPAHIHKPRDT